MLSVIGIAILVAVVVGVSFAFFNYTRTGSTNLLRVVLTTEEWNSLQSGGLSFKVKVEANEGTWIQWPIISTISSCEGCVYAYHEPELVDYYHVGRWYYGENGTVLTSSDYTNNYEELVNAGHNFFLGLKLDETGKITNSYACGIKGENPNQGTAFCIEGSPNGSTYATNRDIVSQLYDPYDNETGLGCYFDDPEFQCFGSISAGMNDGGSRVDVYADGVSCFTSSNAGYDWLVSCESY